MQLDYPESDTNVPNQQLIHLLQLSQATPSAASSVEEKPLPSRFQPNEFDIICGSRGNTFAKHPGNKKFSEAVRLSAQRYFEAPKRIDKSIVVASGVSLLREEGSRFLSLDQKLKRYYEISEAEAHVKTGHAIRDLLKVRNPSTRRRRYDYTASASSTYFFELHRKNPPPSSGMDISIISQNTPVTSRRGGFRSVEYN
jgi:hypothetical protein